MMNTNILDKCIKDNTAEILNLFFIIHHPVQHNHRTPNVNPRGRGVFIGGGLKFLRNKISIRENICRIFYA